MKCEHPYWTVCPSCARDTSTGGTDGNLGRGIDFPSTAAPPSSLAAEPPITTVADLLEARHGGAPWSADEIASLAAEGEAPRLGDDATGPEFPPDEESIAWALKAALKAREEAPSSCDGAYVDLRNDVTTALVYAANDRANLRTLYRRLRSENERLRAEECVMHPDRTCYPVGYREMVAENERLRRVCHEDDEDDDGDEL